MPRVCVFGATGHTGRLAVQALRDRGAEVLACGRNAAALASFEEDGVATRRVDVTRRAEVDAALRGADAVANLAGPFIATGSIPVESAIAEGIPYADTTGEQAFMHASRERYHEAARRAGSPVVHALAFEYAFGDLAASAELPGGGEALHVFYRPRGAGASAGTKKSIARVLAAPALSYEGGALRRVAAGRWRRVFPTAEGPRTGVSFAGGEVVTVPRHTRFSTVRTYIAATPTIARITRLAAPLARVALRGPMLGLVERAIDARHEPPMNARARGEVHLLADPGSPSERHVVVHTPDPYVATAHILAEGLLRARGAGVLAPAEAMDAKDALGAMGRALPGFRVELR